MKEQPIYSSSLSLGLKDGSFVPLKSWLTSTWHVARERVTHAMRWKTPGPMCSQNRSELQVPVLAEREPFWTLGSFQEWEQAVTWLMVVGRTPSKAPPGSRALSTSFICAAAIAPWWLQRCGLWLVSFQSPLISAGLGVKFTSYPLQLQNYTVETESYQEKSFIKGCVCVCVEIL